MPVITEEARRWADREYPEFEMQVTATDILVRGLQHPHAMPLLAAVAQVAGTPVATGR